MTGTVLFLGLTVLLFCALGRSGTDRPARAVDSWWVTRVEHAVRSLARDAVRGVRVIARLSPGGRTGWPRG